MATINNLLQQMIAYEASDLHLTSGERIRVRLHGDLVPITEEPMDEDMLVKLMKEACREEQWQRFLEKQELDFSYGVPQVGRFRCNYFVHSRGHGAVYRMIPERIRSLRELNMPAVVGKMIQFTSGLLLVTGPTGSGKSTTLAAIINEINHTVGKHIITIEDPLEFIHKSERSLIFQREVGADTPSFYDALADALHEDPDVIVVGEMRDRETISLAIKAAEMGVLVLGTLHTNSAPMTVDRIIDSFPSDQQDQVRSMLAESLRGIISQQLLRRKDGTGRVCAVEILIEGGGLANLIRDGNVSKLYSYMQTNRKNLGTQMMDMSLGQFVLEGLVAPVEAYRKASDKKGFEQFFKDNNIDFNVEEAYRSPSVTRKPKKKG